MSVHNRLEPIPNHGGSIKLDQRSVRWVIAAVLAIDARGAAANVLERQLFRKQRLKRASDTK